MFDICQVMPQPHQELEDQDHADRLPKHKLTDNNEDLLNIDNNKVPQDLLDFLNDVLNNPQPSPAADPVSTRTMSFNDF